MSNNITENLNSFLNEYYSKEVLSLKDKYNFQSSLNELFLEIELPFNEFVSNFNESINNNQSFEFDWNLLEKLAQLWLQWATVIMEYLSKNEDIDPSELRSLKLYEKIAKIQELRLNNILNSTLVFYLEKLIKNNFLLYNIILTSHRIDTQSDDIEITSVDHIQMILSLVFETKSYVNFQTVKPLTYLYQAECQSKSYLMCQTHLDHLSIKEELFDISFNDPFTEVFLRIIPETLRQSFIPNVVYKFILDNNCNSSDPTKNLLWLANRLLQTFPAKMIPLYVIQMVHVEQSDSQSDYSHKLFSKLDLTLLIRSNPNNHKFSQKMIAAFLDLLHVIIKLNYTQQIESSSADNSNAGYELLYTLIYVIKALPHCFYGVLRHGIDKFPISSIEESIAPYIKGDNVKFFIPAIGDSSTAVKLAKALAEPSSFYYSQIEDSKLINIIIRDSYWILVYLDRVIQAIQNVYHSLEFKDESVEAQLDKYTSNLFDLSFQLVSNILNPIQTNLSKIGDSPSDTITNPLTSNEQLTANYIHTQSTLTLTKLKMIEQEQDFIADRTRLFELLFNAALQLKSPEFFDIFIKDVSIPKYLHHSLGETLNDSLMKLTFESSVHSSSYPIDKTQLILARWLNQFKQLDPSFQNQALETLTCLFASRKFQLEDKTLFDCSVLLNYVSKLDTEIRHHGVILTLLFLKFQTNLSMVSLKRIVKFAVECLFDSFNFKIQNRLVLDPSPLFESIKQLFYEISQRGCADHVASLFVNKLFFHIDYQNSLTNVPIKEPMTINLFQENREYVGSDRGTGATHTDLPRYKKNYRNQLQETASSCYFPQFPDPTNEQFSNLADLLDIIKMFNYSPAILSKVIKYLASEYQFTSFMKSEFDLFKKKYAIVPMAIPEWELLNKFISHPYLIDLLLKSTEHKELTQKTPKIFLSLLVSLTAFWTSKGRFEGQSIKKSTTRDFPVYLYLTEKLILCLGQINLITSPLNYVHSMSSELTCIEMGQILNKSIWSYIQFTNNGPEVDLSAQSEFTLPSKQKLRQMKGFLKPIHDITRLRLDQLSPFFPIFFTSYGKVFENVSDWN